jgi:branched-chain amino acid transport system substrate-binding protein
MQRRLGMRLAAMAASIALVVGGVALGTTAGATSSSTSNSQGVTSNSITVGAIGSLTGPLASDFADLVPGVKAYFDMVNAQGGVNGRKINLAYDLDDGGNPSEFSTLARTLVNQDHVFAIVGVSTYFFSPTYFTSVGIPTYGYNVSGNWANAPNLYAAGGSYLCYSCGIPTFSYVVHQAKAKSVAIVAYNVSSSSDACSTAGSMFRKAGIKVAYEDLSAPIDGNLAPDVQRISSSGANFILSCMDVTGNISMARAIKQYGLHVHQLWLNGSDQSVLNRYSNLMQGVYFYLANVPLTAPTQDYPGLKTYLSAMKKYEPGFVGSALAVQGWENASLFVQGLRAAGSNLTWSHLTQVTNQITDDTGSGLTSVTNWKYAHSATGPNPICSAFVQVQGRQLKSVFGKGHQVFVCLGKNQTAVKSPTPQTPPAGTPGT